jgi:acetylornithine/N-succinyldiaminopimelate aminotransferase
MTLIYFLGETLEKLKKNYLQGNIAGIIIEGIQGVGGIHVPNDGFLKSLSNLSKKYGAKLILDEVQSGYGRTGRFFAHQWLSGLMPDLVTVAKGMGNGFPIGGVLIHPDIKASHLDFWVPPLVEITWPVQQVWQFWKF